MICSISRSPRARGTAPCMHGASTLRTGMRADAAHFVMVANSCGRIATLNFQRPCPCTSWARA
eukprot:1447185-Pyramimonas_sp.AAC.1